GRYGGQLAVDGVLRVAAAGLLFAVGVQDAWVYGVVLVLAPVLAVLLTTPRPGALVTAGPALPTRPVVAALGALIVASVLSQALANLAVVVVELLAGPDEPGATGEFTAALVIARVPLF